MNAELYATLLKTPIAVIGRNSGGEYEVEDIEVKDGVLTFMVDD